MFLEQRSCQIFSVKKSSGLLTPVSVSSWCSVVLCSRGQGSLLFGMSGLTAHDARYASSQEERARPIYKRAKGPKGASGRAPLQSPRFFKAPLDLPYCSGLLSVGSSRRAPASCCSPLEEGFGETWFPDDCLAAPAATFKLSVSLATDHDQVEFLGTDVPGL